MCTTPTSTSFLAGRQRAGSAFNEPMFAALEKVRPGVKPVSLDPVQVTAFDGDDGTITAD